MSDHMTVDVLESRLLELSEHISYPAVPALVPAVRGRLDARPHRAWLPLGTLPQMRTALLVAAFIVILATGILVASPTTREAVADWLGIDGIRITFDEDAVSNEEGPAIPTVGTGLDLGRRVSIDEAGDHTGFTVSVPAVLGDPDAVFLNPEVPGGEVSLVYEPRPDLPEVGSSGAGALVTQFRGSADNDAYLKKLAEYGTEVVSVTVSGHQGFWISGAPHLLVSEFATPSTRVAGNTLIWEDHGITYRVEADVTLGKALEIAESLR